MGDKDTQFDWNNAEIVFNGQDAMPLGEVHENTCTLEESKSFPMPASVTLALATGTIDTASDILSRMVANTVCCKVSEGEIVKPKNLKYPNKKRARRVLRKWRNRFGRKARYTLIPRAKISIDPLAHKITLIAQNVQ